jgi:monoterpene epsilon-lactone hydrolase
MKMRWLRETLSAAALLAAGLAPATATDAQTAPAPANAARADEAPSLRTYIPTTISPEAAAIYRAYRAFILLPQPVPHDAADFQALYNKGEARGIPGAEATVRKLGATVVERTISGVTVYEVTPKDYRDDGTIILDVHGGGFILGSARSNLGGPAMMATATGKRVITIDYTVAPRGNWRIVTDQVAGVYKALLDQGVPAKHIGMVGGSAGGTIVAASVLKIRDRGLPMPAALLLISPMTDATEGGDTRMTLAEADPALHPDQVRPGLDAYAAPADQKNPYVSPVYGDFTKGYPPVLIQGGTKEWLLSDFVRLHRAIRAAGGNSDLEIYEGMPHGFPSLMTNAPEGKQAAAEQLAYWKRYLPGTVRPARKH